MQQADAERIEVYSLWVGFSDPPSRVGKLVLSKCGNGYERKVFPNGPIDEVSFEIVANILLMLSGPIVAKLNPKLFRVPEAVIQRHYGSGWTDDDPGLLVKVHFKSGRVITIETRSQHAFMLPLTIKDSIAKSHHQTFDPALAESLATLMPDGFCGKHRLSGELLESEREELEKMTARLDDSSLPAEPIPEDDQSSPTLDFDDLFRKLRGEESPEEKASAKESGRWSERLLKKIPYEEMHECLDNSADPNIADEWGQTALMYAAGPPFESRRFRLLVKAGANVDACRYDGLNGLQLACLGGESRAATEWVKAGANIHARTPEGATPLMLGARWTQVVAMLLKAGAEVNAIDDDGHSALTHAIVRPIRWEATDSSMTVQTLIEAGADVNRRDRQGITALGHARRVLAEFNLEEEVFRAFHPERSFRNDRVSENQRLVDEIIHLVESAGGKA